MNPLRKRTLVRTPRCRRRRDAGFTLIELLIVIVVIAVLSGIAVVSTAPFRGAAERTAGDIDLAAQDADEARAQSVAASTLDAEEDLTELWVPAEVDDVDVDLDEGDVWVDGDLEFTVTITDSAGDPLEGIEVRIVVSGENDETWPEDGDAALRTGSNGQVEVSYSSDSTGTDTITACTGRYGRAPVDCDDADVDDSEDFEWENEPPPGPGPGPGNGEEEGGGPGPPDCTGPPSTRPPGC